MTETSNFLLPEGRERLRHQTTLWLDLTKEDFDFDNGQIFFFSFGRFMASQIDPETGEFIYDDEAADSIRRTRTICLYSPNAEEGYQIFVQFVDKTSDGSLRQASLLFEFRDSDFWVPSSQVDSRIVDMRPGKTSLARTTNPFQLIY